MPKKGEEPSSEKKVEAAKIVKKTRGAPKKTDTLGEIAVRTQSARTKPPSLFLYTLYFLYKNLYCLGVSLLRYRLRVIRRIRMGLLRQKGSLYALGHHISQGFSRGASGFRRRLRAPFVRISDAYELQLPVIHTMRAEKKLVLPAYLPVAEQILRLIWKIIRTIINYAAPVVAAWFLLTSVGELLNRPIGLLLEYNGQELGYIENEARFDDATQIIRDRMTAGSTEQFTADVPAFTLRFLQTRFVSLIDSATLADRIFRTSDEDIVDAYGFTVGNDFLGAVMEKDAILDELNTIIAENATGRRDERVEFSKYIELTPPIPFPASSIVDASGIIERIRSNEEERRMYIVEEGDSPTLIADKVNMPYAQLRAMNPGIEEELFIGQEVLVQGARPYLTLRTIFTDEYEEEVPFETIETENALYARGYSETTEEGVNGRQLVTAEITLENGIETNREVLNTVSLLEPVPARVTVGVNNPQTIVSSSGSGTGAGTDRSPSGASSSSGFIWPTVGGHATTYPGQGYTAIDIAPGGGGHPIYASAAGTVILVEYGWVGYGHQIVIDHGNGFRTRYAHNSANYVAVGDKVAQGQVIAAMGSTGNSTGNHLHFEILLNGRAQWPPDYVGSSG